MTNDIDWVEHVKRWYRAGGSTATRTVDSLVTDYGDDVGYEAAHPALQARHWPDAATLTTDR